MLFTCICRVTNPATPSISFISTIAGNGAVNANTGDGGDPLAASMLAPSGLALNQGTETVLLVSAGPARIRLIRLKPAPAYITSLVGTETPAYASDGDLPDAPTSLTRVGNAHALYAEDLDPRGNFLEVLYGEQSGNRLRKLTVASWGVLRVSASGQVTVNRFAAP